jgi:hypothetical protein
LDAAQQVSGTAAATEIDPEWLAGAGRGTEMGERVRAFDWASTPLGPMHGWPEALRTAVTMCLSTRFPVLVTWGPDLIKIYNDAYRPLLGSEKHPRALGAPTREVWSEIWDRIGPLFDQVLTTGQPTWDEDQPLFVDRNGFLEEAWFTWSYSALRDEDGTIAGVFDIAMETTEKVVSERRLRSLAALQGEVLGARQITEVALRAVNALTPWRADIEAADLYLRAGEDHTLVATNQRGRTAPTPLLDVRRVAESGEVELVGQVLPGGPVQRVLVPLRGDAGVLALSLNPMLPFDAGYERYVGLVASTIGEALASAELHAKEIGEHRTVSQTLQAAMLTPATDDAGLAARYLPAAGNLSVGGDWYDLVDLGDDREALIVGDCVGHGLHAATTMGQLRSAARAMVLEDPDPAVVLHALDRFAETIADATCATVACAVVDHRAGTITYSRAGHPPPLLACDGEVRCLEQAGGVPLAVDPTLPRVSAIEPFQDGDSLVLYSDGLIERRGETLDDGLERLASSLRAHRGAPANDLADALLAEVLPHDQRDDVVLVVRQLDA